MGLPWLTKIVGLFQLYEDGRCAFEGEFLENTHSIDISEIQMNRQYFMNARFRNHRTSFEFNAWKTTIFFYQVLHFLDICWCASRNGFSWLCTLTRKTAWLNIRYSSKIRLKSWSSICMNFTKFIKNIFSSYSEFKSRLNIKPVIRVHSFQRWLWV